LQTDSETTVGSLARGALTLVPRQIDLVKIARLGKEFGWTVAGNVAAVLGGLVGVRLLTELLDPGTYGQLALAMTLVTLLNQALMGPLSQGVMRFYAPAVEARNLGNYFAASQKLLLAATWIVSALTAITVASLLAFDLTHWIGLALASMAFATAVGYNTVLNGIQIAARQRSVVALHQGIEPWLRLLFGVALIFYVSKTSTAALTGYAIALTLIVGSQYWFYRRLPRESAVGKSDDWAARIWAYSWPFASWGVFSWAQQSSDRWALGLFASTEDVGLYAVLWQVGFYPVSLAIGTGVQFLAPIFYGRAGDASDPARRADMDRLTYRLIGLVLGATAVMLLTAFLLHGWLFSLIAAPEYQSVSSLLPWVVLAGGLFAAGQTIALNLMSRTTTAAMIAAKILSCLVGIGLNFLFAYLYGMSGAVVAGMVFSLVYLVWMIVLFQRR
jgi:O-antigen/teichoic acid export membrane protein